MKTIFQRYRRFLPIAIILAALFLISDLFKSFVVNEILVPIAAAVWLLLRIFILRVGQIYYWIVLSALGFLFVVYRVVHHLAFRPTPRGMDSSPDPSVALLTAEGWRNRIQLAAGGSAEQAILKRELAWVLVSMYTYRHSGSAYHEVYEPLRQKKIPLPEEVWAFIFEEELPRRRKKLGFFQSMRQAGQSQIKKWSGRETAEYYQVVADVLSFMEKSLEINDENQ